MTDIRQLFAALDGAVILGGCEYCNAEQVPSIDALGVMHITISHDDTCPWLQQQERRQVGR
jgi:hypothetical protein